MADFRTHIATSTVVGVAYGGAGCVLYDVPLPTGLLAGGLCAMAGMMPDLDSGSGVPLRESTAFASAVAPLLIIQRLREFGVSPEVLVLAGAAAYLVIRFAIGFLLRRLTVHRGMFHSIPAVIIAGELTFLMASGDSVALRWYKAGAVMLGYLSHLMLDEFYSVQATRLRVKKSFGTALKMLDRKQLWPNLSAYAKLALLSYVVFYEPSWAAQYQEHLARFGQSKLVRQTLESHGLNLPPAVGDVPASLAEEPSAVGQQGPSIYWR